MREKRNWFEQSTRRWLLALIAGCLCAGLLGIPSNRPAAAGGPQTGAYASGQILVGMKEMPGKGAWQAADRLSSRLGADVATVHPQLRLLVMRVPAGREEQALAQARKNPDVAFAELNYMARAAAGAPEALPDDPLLGEQWALEKMGVPFAWTYSQGGPDVLVAVLDSGVQLAHPDLQDQIWTNPGEIPDNGKDDDGNGKVDDVHGWHFYHTSVSGTTQPAEDNLVDDDFGHGTRVAGIIAAKAGNGLGIAGIAPASQVLPVKVLNAYGSGYYADIAAGIIYAVDQGAKIINLSLGGPFDSQVLREAAAYARGRGVMLIAAAGNCAPSVADCDQPVLYPAAIDSVIAVAASGANDARAAFSHTGPELDLAAPGVRILSTNYRSNYFTDSGTSFAAPHAAGAAALLWGYRPEFSLEEVEALLTSSAVDIEAPGKDNLTGWGRVSANRAVGKIEGLPDLWVGCEVSSDTKTNQRYFVIRYGNDGYGASETARIHTMMTLEGGPVIERTWVVGLLTPGVSPADLILRPQDAPPGSIISLDLYMEAPSADFEPRNDQAHCQLTTNRLLYLPFVSEIYDDRRTLQTTTGD